MAKKKRFYGKESRSYSSNRGSEFLSDDPSAPARCPQDVKYHAWPDAGRYALDQSVPDLFDAVTQQQGEDARMLRKVFKLSKP